MPIDKVVVKKITMELRQPTGSPDSPDYIPANRGVEVEYAFTMDGKHSGAGGKSAVLSSAARELLHRLWVELEDNLNAFLLGNAPSSENRAAVDALPPLVPIPTEE